MGKFKEMVHIPNLEEKYPGNQGPLLLPWIKFAWVSNYIHYNVWDEITYLLPNFNGETVEV